MVNPTTSCASYHPGEESILMERIRRWNDGREKRETYCTLCGRYREKLRNETRRRLMAIRRAHPSGMPYGVVPLNWTPPERLIASLPAFQTIETP